MSGVIMSMLGAAFGTRAGQQLYNNPGIYTWVAPPGVTSVSVVAVGGGGGAGGGLGYKNNYSVTPGSSYSVVVGDGRVKGSAGTSYFVDESTCAGFGAASLTGGGGYAGDGGGNGGNFVNTDAAGGGGAGGYSGNGGNGSINSNTNGSAGSGGGGGGGGGSSNNYGGGGGGGVGVLGEGSSGSGGATGGGSTGGVGGGGGSSGSAGTNGSRQQICGDYYADGGPGGFYGGGSGYSNPVRPQPKGGDGAVRIIWAGSTGITRTFPSTNTGDL
jgi:hypothetical protein